MFSESEVLRSGVGPMGYGVTYSLEKWMYGIWSNVQSGEMNMSAYFVGVVNTYQLADGSFFVRAQQ
jgi:hypothetical protein